MSQKTDMVQDIQEMFDEIKDIKQEILYYFKDYADIIDREDMMDFLKIINREESELMLSVQHILDKYFK